MSPNEYATGEDAKEIRLGNSRDQIENTWVTVYMFIDIEQKEKCAHFHV